MPTNPDIAMKLAGGITTEQQFAGMGLSRGQEFVRKSQKAAKEGPDAITKLLTVEAHRQNQPPGEKLEQLDTKINLIGEGPVDPTTRQKDLSKDPEALDYRKKATEGKQLAETLRDYHKKRESANSAASPTRRQDLADIQALQDRYIRNILSRPNGKSIITEPETNVAGRREQADLFIQKHYDDLKQFATEDTIRIVEDPKTNPASASEQVLNSKNRYNDAEFAKNEAEEAVKETTKHLEDLIKEHDDYNQSASAGLNAAGEKLYTQTANGRLEFLQDTELKRQGNLITTTERVKQAQQKLEDIKNRRQRQTTKADYRDKEEKANRKRIRELEGERLKVNTLDILKKRKLDNEIQRLQAKKFDKPAKGDWDKDQKEAQQEFESATKEQMRLLTEQQEYQYRRERKQALPKEIIEAKTAKNKAASETLKAGDALSKASEDLYSAKRMRRATERELAESVNDIVDFALHETLNREIAPLGPMFKEGMTKAEQERLADIDRRLLERVRTKGIIRKNTVRWDDLEIKDTLKMLINADDIALDDYINRTTPLGSARAVSPLVDNYVSLEPEEQAKIRAALASRIVTLYQRQIGKTPSESDLLALQMKGWVDPLIDLAITNVPEVADRIKQEVPDEEVKPDNPVMKAKLKSKFLVNSGLFLFLLTMSASSLAKEEKH